MPEHNPEDRVRIKNIINLDGDDIQTFWITRYRKQDRVDANGMVSKIEVPFEKEIEWNFRNGFFTSWGGKFYTLKPLEVKSYPRFLAEHIAKHIMQYLINKEYLSTKRTGEDGTPRYNSNILNNEAKKKALMSQIIEGVEEWYEDSDSDFDTLLAQQFGGDFEGIAEEKVNKEDFELPEIEQDSTPKVEKPKKEIPSTSDPELAKARDEADVLEIEYSDRDTVESIKAKIIKFMA